MVDANSMEWPKWVLFMAVGGYAGKFCFQFDGPCWQWIFTIPLEMVPVIAVHWQSEFLVMPLLCQGVTSDF
jgi:hypothetical protein